MVGYKTTFAEQANVDVPNRGDGRSGNATEQEAFFLLRGLAIFITTEYYN